MSTRLDSARNTMLDAHKGQTRNDNVTPYAAHPERVVSILKTLHVTDEDILIAGYLHDVLEDTDYPPNDLKTSFGSNVLSLVNELTFIPNIDDESYWEQIEKMSKNAKIIKLADLLANLTDNSKKSVHFVYKRVHALELIIIDLNLTNCSIDQLNQTKLSKTNKWIENYIKPTKESNNLV